MSVSEGVKFDSFYFNNVGIRTLENWFSHDLSFTTCAWDFLLISKTKIAIKYHTTKIIMHKFYGKNNYYEADKFSLCSLLNLWSVCQRLRLYRALPTASKYPHVLWVITRFLRNFSKFVLQAIELAQSAFTGLPWNIILSSQLICPM